MAWYFVMIIHLEKRKRRKRGGRGWAEEEEKEKKLSFLLTKNLLKDEQTKRVKMEKIIFSVIQGGGSKSKTKTV